MDIEQLIAASRSPSPSAHMATTSATNNQSHSAKSNLGSDTRRPEISSNIRTTPPARVFVAKLAIQLPNSDHARFSKVEVDIRLSEPRGNLQTDAMQEIQLEASDITFVSSRNHENIPIIQSYATPISLPPISSSISHLSLPRRSSPSPTFPSRPSNGPHHHITTLSQPPLHFPDQTSTSYAMPSASAQSVASSAKTGDSLSSRVCTPPPTSLTRPKSFPKSLSEYVGSEYRPTSTPASDLSGHPFKPGIALKDSVYNQTPTHPPLLSHSSVLTVDSNGARTPPIGIMAGAATMANKNITLPLKPAPVSERMIAPCTGRSSEEDTYIKTCTVDALKHARQWAGSRPSPLIQVDRFLSRIELFCYLHKQVRWPPMPGKATDEGPLIYWSDLLKSGGLGTAWNEKKSRRPYKHIYSDLVEHQNNPVIKPYLESERGKSLDDLEASFESLLNRGSVANVYGINNVASSASSAIHQLPADMHEMYMVSSSTRETPSVETSPRDGTNEAINPDLQSTNASSRKRKRDDEMPITLLSIPSERLTPPSSRPAGAEADVKQVLVSAMIAANQWSGSRPAVISSVQALVARIMLLIRIHSQETAGSHVNTIYWSDCIKHGGISQAWSSKKAGRAAFRQTYNQLVQFQKHPDIVKILSDQHHTDVKTVEGIFARIGLPEDANSVTDAGSQTNSPSILGAGDAAVDNTDFALPFTHLGDSPDIPVLGVNSNPSVEVQQNRKLRPS